MNFKTVNDLNDCINKNLHKIPSDVDLIVGIPRSGLFVASLISLYLNIPLTDIDSLLNNKIFESGISKIKKSWIKDAGKARKILIVEDSCNTGLSISKVKQKLSKYKYKNKIIYLAAYVTTDAIKNVDVYFEICEQPRMFEWNYLHHGGVANACFDIDGVLCPDPTEEQNDDGKEYKKFIKNVKPRYIPTFEIGYLVTCRLEKYRSDTEYWLNKNGIKYKNLIMMNFKTKEERIKSGSHGKFKGEQYKNLENTNLFVESSAKQAREIANISGKTVFCTENSQIYEYEQQNTPLQKPTKLTFKQKITKYLPTHTKILLKKIFYKKN